MTDTGASATERRFTMPRCDAGTQAHSTVGIAATTSTLFDLGDASPKRTSTHIGDLETPSPSPNRMKHDARSPIGTLEITTFWYPDGNVVVKSDATYYKLHSSRLARHCVYFKKLFADDVDDYEDRAFTDGPPTQTVACALLRAAHSLSCDVVYKLAKARSPTAPSHLAILFPTVVTAASSPSCADADDQRSHENAIFIIHFARQYGLPELLKRAFYELLASARFWAVLAADRKQIRLTEDDLLRLDNARLVLQDRRREALVVAPRTPTETASSRYEPATERPQRWRSMMLESGLVEGGTGDPMRFDVIGALTQEQRQPWCHGCLKAWGDTLAERRMDWWASFGDLMQSA
ncbi:hypothetical protein VTO73DRAFT_15091 [Trametes versicolor]